MLKFKFLLIASCSVLIINAQNVGIGTAAPRTSLEINGGLTIAPRYVTVVSNPYQVPDNASHLFVSSSLFASLDLIPPLNPVPGQKLFIRDVGTQPATKFLFEGVSFRNQMEFIYTSNGAISKWEPVNFNNGGIVAKAKFATILTNNYTIEDNIGQLFLSSSSIPVLTLTPPPNPIAGQRIFIRDLGTVPTTEFIFGSTRFRNQMEFIYTSSGAVLKWEPVCFINGGVSQNVKYHTAISNTYNLEDNIGVLFLSTSSLSSNLTITPPPNPIEGQRLFIRDISGGSTMSFGGFVFKEHMEFIYTRLGATTKWEPVFSLRNEAFNEVGQPGAPPFGAGWAAYGGGNASPAFYKDKEGRVHLRGLLNSGPAGSIIFNLPSGYRPSTSGQLMFTVNNGNSFARIDIWTNGDVVFPILPVPGTWVSLDGISFRSD
jgi:hypothetical protein